ncbi:uncharacterized protein [Montipora foliosa]|uniref:uncharacterized protein n=1 Tax=Montipora foliosa TaxID=591990 RepID=UPI0035F1A994
MSSIITSLLKATLGFLVDKARDRAVEKLKDGDVVDQKIREIIAREIEDVKSKLDALSRKDLLAAIDAFETGVGYLYKAMDLQTDAATKARQRTDEAQLKEAVSLTTSPAPVDSIVLAAGIRNMELTEFIGEARRALSEGKERFKMAREEATKAFNNESLSTLDRITAIRYRVMAAILKSAVEILGAASELSSLSVKIALKGALPECEQCLRKLHSLPDVKNNFKVELKKGLLNIRGRFKKEDRREIIAAVWQVNLAINDVLQATGENIDICYYPTIDIEDETIDPQRDGRVAEVLQKLGIDHKGIVWSFGEDGEDDHKLKNAKGIAINADGEFILVDDDKSVKVFDNNGKFIYKFYPHVRQTGYTGTELLAVATDENNNTYVLVRDQIGRNRLEVQVFNGAELGMKFHVYLGEEWVTKLRVVNGKVLALAGVVVGVYDLNGRYERSFGRGILSVACDIAVGPGGQIFVLNELDCIVFNEDGVKKHEFTVSRGLKELPCGLAVHPLGEFVFLVGVDIDTRRSLTVQMYTEDGEFYRKITLRENVLFYPEPPLVAINKEGRLAVTCKLEGVNAMVIVL